MDDHITLYAGYAGYAVDGRRFQAEYLPSLALLGLQPVASDRGSGTALYQLRQSLQLVSGHKGQLLIESRLGAGTKATLIVPQREAPW